MVKHKKTKLPKSIYITDDPEWEWELLKKELTSTPGSYFFFFEDMIGNLTFLETGILCLLINHCIRVKAFRKNNGWFYMTMKTICDKTKISKNTQTRIIKKLEEEDFIATRREGHRARRFIKINYGIIRNYTKRLKEKKIKKMRM